VGLSKEETSRPNPFRGAQVHNFGLDEQDFEDLTPDYRYGECAGITVQTTIIGNFAMSSLPATTIENVDQLPIAPWTHLDCTVFLRGLIPNTIQN
jgi:hypothetical protein